MVNKFNALLLSGGGTKGYSYIGIIKYFEENNFPKQIDYLSIDVDGNYRFDGTRETNNSLLSLITLPLTTYRFSIIHYEHDICGNYKNTETRDAQREILTSLDYSLLVSNVEEDWWVDPKIVPWLVARKFAFFDQNKYEVRED